MAPKMEWQLVRDGKAWQGTLTLPIMDAGRPEPSGKVMKIKGKKAPSKQKALENVGKTALKALENPIVQSILPPGAGAAIQAVKALASPKVARAVARHGKKALRAVARVFR